MTNYTSTKARKAREKKLMFYENYADGLDGIINKTEILTRLDLIFNDILLKVDLKGKKFLDAGCGLGQFSQVASSRGAKVTGVEVGKKLLKIASKKAPIKTIVGSVLDLPFKDNTFDFVLCTEVIEHTEHPDRAIKELLRVAKPGGKVLITTPNRILLFPIFLASLLKIRKYQGLENWIYTWDFRKYFKENRGKIIREEGFNLFYPRIFKSLEEKTRIFDLFMWNYFIYGKKLK